MGDACDPCPFVFGIVCDAQQPGLLAMAESWAGTAVVTKLAELPIYGSERLGLMRPNVLRDTVIDVTRAIFTRRVDQKEYELKDHLGNVRVVVSDMKTRVTGTNFTLIVKSVNNYYAFGMLEEGMSGSSGDYRYGYNGKEMDNELKGTGNSLDYGARMYDARLGRWGSVDPAKAAYPSYAPYVFGLNSPLNYKDDDGQLVKDTEGNIIVLRKGEQDVSNTSERNENGYKFNDRTIFRGIRIDIITNSGSVLKDVSYIASSTILHRQFLEIGTDKVLRETSYDFPDVETRYNCFGNCFAQKNIVIGNINVPTSDGESFLESEGWTKTVNISEAKAGDVGLYLKTGNEYYHAEIFLSGTAVSSKGGAKLDPGPLKPKTNPEQQQGLVSYEVRRKEISDIVIVSPNVAGPLSTNQIRMDLTNFPASNGVRAVDQSTFDEVANKVKELNESAKEKKANEE